MDPDREPLPDDVEPMLAKPGGLPDGDGWAFEIKWDGVRALAFCADGRLRLHSRRGGDITPRYPELEPLGRALGARQALLDGEIVAFGADGRPSFERLQRRMHLTDAGLVRRLAQSEPVVYAIFDVLHLQGHSLLELRYEQRRTLLDALALAGPAWQVPAYHRGDGAALLAATRAQRLEGVVAKRLDSPYRPGSRSGAWLKVKNVRTADVVVGGWLPGEGQRAGRLGALVTGVHRDGELRYAGRVGSGFTQAELDRVARLLAPLARADTPFSGTQPPKATHFVEPRLVAVVEYGELTASGTLRHPRYKGLRDDVLAADVGPPDA